MNAELLAVTTAVVVMACLVSGHGNHGGPVGHQGHEHGGPVGHGGLVAHGGPVGHGGPVAHGGPVGHGGPLVHGHGHGGPLGHRGHGRRGPLGHRGHGHGGLVGFGGRGRRGGHGRRRFHGGRRGRFNPFAARLQRMNDLRRLNRQRLRDRERNRLDYLNSLGQRNRLQAQRRNDLEALQRRKAAEEVVSETNFSQKKDFQVHIVDKSSVNFSHKTGHRRLVDDQVGLRKSEKAALDKLDESVAQQQLHADQARAVDAATETVAKDSEKLLAEDVHAPHHRK